MDDLDRDKSYEKGRRVQTGPLDFHEAQEQQRVEQEAVSTEDVVGTSGQQGAGRAELPRAETADNATIEDDEDIATPGSPMRLNPSADEDAEDARTRTAGHVDSALEES